MFWLVDFGKGVGPSTITCTIRADIGTIGRDIYTRAETTAPAWTAPALTEVTVPAPPVRYRDSITKRICVQMEPWIRFEAVSHLKRLQKLQIVLRAVSGTFHFHRRARRARRFEQF